MQCAFRPITHGDEGHLLQVSGNTLLHRTFFERLNLPARRRCQQWPVEVFFDKRYQTPPNPIHRKVNCCRDNLIEIHACLFEMMPADCGSMLSANELNDIVGF
jgi:hypothetical protein